MNLEKLVSISGMSGIHLIVATKDNGLIVEDFDTKKKRFISARKHQFSPLESISIFTDDGDSADLSKVFQNMMDQVEDNPLPDPKSKKEVLLEYFEDVLPNYDKDKVYPSDVKKLIKWYSFLNERDLFNRPKEEKKEEEAGK